MGSIISPSPILVGDWSLLPLYTIKQICNLNTHHPCCLSPIGLVRQFLLMALLVNRMCIPTVSTYIRLYLVIHIQNQKL